MAEFTKGKWKIDNSEAFREHIYVIEPSGVYHCIAHIVGMWNDEYSIQANANARLIAAAQDMYRLLEVWTQIHAQPTLRNAQNSARELLVRINGEEEKNG